MTARRELLILLGSTLLATATVTATPAVAAAASAETGKAKRVVFRLGRAAFCLSGYPASFSDDWRT